MKITLHQLNESWQALHRLTTKEFPKDQHKVQYKLARIYKQAKAEVESLADSLNALMKKCGLTPGAQADPEKLQDYNTQSKLFLRETWIEFSWGDPILHADIRDFVTISPADLAELDWLIQMDEEPAKAKTAAS